MAANSRKMSLRHLVAALVQEGGFDKINNSCLETLTELLQCYLVELALSSKSLAELAGRTDLMITDLNIAFIEAGVNIQGLINYARRPNRLPLGDLIQQSQAAEAKVLQIAEPQPFPSHIPAYLDLPKFPDPHTYIKTQTQKAPADDYKVIREKIATQKRDTDLALTRFLAKTGDSENLFSDEPYAFPLIANKPKSTPYYEALLPKEDEIFGDESKHQKDDAIERSEGENEYDTTKKQSSSGQAKLDASGSVSKPYESESDGPIDNPYLRPINMPKLKTNNFRKPQV